MKIKDEEEITIIEKSTKGSTINTIIATITFISFFISLFYIKEPTNWIGIMLNISTLFILFYAFIGVYNISEMLKDNTKERTIKIKRKEK